MDKKRIAIISVVAIATIIVGSLATFPLENASPENPLDETEYEPLSSVQNADIHFLIEEGNTLQIAYEANIQSCTIRDRDGESVGTITPEEPESTLPDHDVIITCQPTGDAFIDEFPQNQEYLSGGTIYSETFHQLVTMNSLSEDEPTETNETRD